MFSLQLKAKSLLDQLAFCPNSDVVAEWCYGANRQSEAPRYAMRWRQSLVPVRSGALTPWVIARSSLWSCPDAAQRSCRAC